MRVGSLVRIKPSVLKTEKWPTEVFEVVTIDNDALPYGLAIKNSTYFFRADELDVIPDSFCAECQRPFPSEETDFLCSSCRSKQ